MAASGAPRHGSLRDPQDLNALVVTESVTSRSCRSVASDDLAFSNSRTRHEHAAPGRSCVHERIEFVFPNNRGLNRPVFPLVRNERAFQEEYPGVTAHGVYSGKLSNDGEILRLATASGVTVFEVTFMDDAPWPIAAAGAGFSATPLDSATPNSNDGTDWRASSAPGGSPGMDDPVPPPDCLLTEALSLSFRR